MKQYQVYKFNGPMRKYYLWMTFNNKQESIRREKSLRALGFKTKVEVI